MTGWSRGRITLRAAPPAQALPTEASSAQSAAPASRRLSRRPRLSRSHLVAEQADVAQPGKSPVVVSTEPNPPPDNQE